MLIVLGILSLLLAITIVAQVRDKIMPPSTAILLVVVVAAIVVLTKEALTLRHKSFLLADIVCIVVFCGVYGRHLVGRVRSRIGR